MNALTWVIIGLAVGWLASSIGDDPERGVIGEVAIGIVGAVLGGLASQALLDDGLPGLEPVSLLGAAIGAIVVVALERRLLTRNGAS